MGLSISTRLTRITETCSLNKIKPRAIRKQLLCLRQQMKQVVIKEAIQQMFKNAQRLPFFVKQNQNNVPFHNRSAICKRYNTSPRLEKFPFTFVFCTCFELRKGVGVSFGPIYQFL